MLTHKLIEMQKGFFIEMVCSNRLLLLRQPCAYIAEAAIAKNILRLSVKWKKKNEELQLYVRRTTRSDVSSAGKGFVESVNDITYLLWNV